MKLKYILVLIAILAIDQISKLAITMNMDLNQSMKLIPDFFNITYLQNTGAAWSMFEGRMVFFYIITIVALIVMVYFYRSSEAQDGLTKLGIVCMIAGTLGNFIDRLIFQYVRDFLDFNIFGYDFPVFNVADVALCIGVGLVFLSVLLESYGGYHKCVK